MTIATLATAALRALHPQAATSATTKIDNKPAFLREASLPPTPRIFVAPSLAASLSSAPRSSLPSAPGAKLADATPQREVDQVAASVAYDSGRLISEPSGRSSRDSVARLDNSGRPSLTEVAEPPAVYRDVLMVDTPLTVATASDRTEAGVARVRRRSQLSLSLAAGSVIGCVLETAIDSTRAGFVTCSVTDDVVGDDARVVLIERGTQVLGEYRADVRQGEARIAVIWNRLRKSDGAIVDLASPAIDPAGGAGIPGGVDNHWFTRIGSAFLLSVIEDAVTGLTAPHGSSSTVVLGNTASGTVSLSQKVLDSSINTAPTLTVRPGARISILVSKDIDFSGIYGIR